MLGVIQNWSGPNPDPSLLPSGSDTNPSLFSVSTGLAHTPHFCSPWPRAAVPCYDKLVSLGPNFLTTVMKKFCHRLEDHKSDRRGSDVTITPHQ